jgi:hypothetical protein
MKFVSAIAAILFFPLAVMFAIERTWLANSLGLIWFAVFAFVLFVGLALGFAFGRARAGAMFGSGATVLLLMWLPLQVYFAPASGFISGAVYFVGLLALVYASLLGGGIGYNLYSRRSSEC